MLMNKIKFIIVTLLLIMSQTALAATITVSGDCSASAVQTAINSASGGDTIDVTCTGTVTWSSGITLTGGKTLRGGGVKGSNGTEGTWPLVINNTSGGSYLIRITNANSQALNRVTGFQFTGTGNPTYVIQVVGRGVGTDGYGSFRIDNNSFNGITASTRVIYTDGDAGQMTGIVDHNVFYYASGYESATYESIYRGSSPTCYGYDSQQRATGHGTSDFVFWEDNYLYNFYVESSGGGGRITMRYNTIHTTESGGFLVLDGHGTDTGGWNACGVVSNEFYKNTITGSGIFQMTDVRGGSWLVYNNTTQSGTIQLQEYRVYRPDIIAWKACSGDFCCPHVPPQCNVQSPTYPTDFAACYPLPYQVQNTFFWNNLRNGSNITPTYPDGYGDVSPWIALNRDYWMPTYGLESALPATCTAGANTFYGATDTGKLWNCDTTNHWTLTYTPYIYPHPLANDAEVDEYMIVIEKSGDGAGTITEGDNINCGTNCSHDYFAYSGQEVTFTATPATGMYFSGWTGGCVGAGLTCTTTISGDATITASFTNGRKCSLGAGGGTITVGP
jgi:hypothetical protein